MNKKDIIQINEIILELSNIPQELLSENESLTLNNPDSKESDRDFISNNIHERIKTVRNLQVKTEAIFRTLS